MLQIILNFCHHPDQQKQMVSSLIFAAGTGSDGLSDQSEQPEITGQPDTSGNPEETGTTAN